MSDLHGYLPGGPHLREVTVPECDVLVIAGDVCEEFTRMFDPDIMRIRQTEWLDSVYRAWEKTVPAKHILVTPGNHDWITKFPEGLRSRLLIDEECVVEGKRFYFTPWVPPVGNWNYLMTRGLRRECFASIPEGLDVLVAHSAAHKVLDYTYDKEHAGCEELRLAVCRAKPKILVHGHIHEGQRKGRHARLCQTDVYNVSLFRQAHEWMPLVLDLP